MFFNTLQRTVKLNPAWDLFIMWKNWKKCCDANVTFESCWKASRKKMKKRLLILNIEKETLYMTFQYWPSCGSNLRYRVFQVTFKCVHSYSPLPGCFSTAFKWLSNLDSVSTHDFQHITKNCQTQSSFSHVENHAEIIKNYYNGNEMSDLCGITFCTRWITMFTFESDLECNLQGFWVVFEFAHHYSLPRRCFSTAV